MTIKDLHDRVVKPVREATTISQCAAASDAVLAVDCSPWAIKAFYEDAPSYYRQGVEMTLGHRAYFARLINGLIKAGFRVLMVLDGVRPPLRRQCWLCVALPSERMQLPMPDLLRSWARGDR